MSYCTQCGRDVGAGAQFCVRCGRAITNVPPLSPPVTTVPPVAAVPPVAVRTPAPAPVVINIGTPAAPALPQGSRVPARAHHPLVALLAGLLIPGAGQAYNGQVVKGFFLLFLSPLVLPQLYALWDSYNVAVRIRDTGGRYGKGGWIWIGLQGWLELNAIALGLLTMTILGVLR